MTAAFNDNGDLDEVFVTFQGSDEGWALGRGDDRYVKDGKKMRIDHAQKETPAQAYLLSPFEAKVLSNVCDKLVQTLEHLEKDLKGNNWDRLLYLDSYFPSFLKNFYYLNCAARNSMQALPASTCIDDSLYETRTDSPKSDQRISKWRDKPDHTIKLRIAAKELVFQIQQWQNKELDNSRRDVWEDNSKKFVESYELFIKLYFNIPP